MKRFVLSGLCLSLLAVSGCMSGGVHGDPIADDEEEDSVPDGEPSRSGAAQAIESQVPPDLEQACLDAFLETGNEDAFRDCLAGALPPGIYYSDCMRICEGLERRCPDVNTGYNVWRWCKWGCDVVAE